MVTISIKCNKWTCRRRSLWVSSSFVFSLYQIVVLFSRLVLFGVYNLTTRALFGERYPLYILLQDIAWGTFYNMAYTCIYMIIWAKLTSPVDL